jgi:hypothetical protein
MNAGMTVLGGGIRRALGNIFDENCQNNRKMQMDTAAQMKSV